MILGLAGFAQSGKSTVAQYLVEEHGFTELAFADGVRQLMERVDPLVHPTTLTYLDVFGSAHAMPYNGVVRTMGYEWAKANTNARDYLVAVGAGAREVIGEDVWVHAVVNQLREARGDYVISDVRYQSEIRGLRSVGGKTIRLVRPGVGPANDEEARSFAEMFGLAARISNDTTVPELHLKVEETLGKLV